MRNLILILVAATFFIGCSKEGSKSRLMDGGTLEQDTATPVDTNFPELNPTKP